MRPASRRGACWPLDLRHGVRRTPNSRTRRARERDPRLAGGTTTRRGPREWGGDLLASVTTLRSRVIVPNAYYYGMRPVPTAAMGIAVLAAGAGLWIAGGNAIAAKREREASRSLESAFGSRAALAAKYALAVSNADAKKAEVLSNAVGYDIVPRQQGSARTVSSVPEAQRAAVSEYLTVQVSRSDSTVEAPSPDLAAILSSHRVALSALEDALVTGEAPRWACDPAVSYEARLSPNGLGHPPQPKDSRSRGPGHSARREGPSRGRFGRSWCDRVSVLCPCSPGH